MPVPYYLPVGPSNKTKIKCWHCGADNEVQIIDVPNISTKNPIAPIEVIDLTIDAKIPLVDLTEDDDEKGDTTLSIIEYILENGERIYDKGLFDVVEKDKDNLRGQYPRTTMDNFHANQNVGGYWSPLAFSIDNK